MAGIASVIANMFCLRLKMSWMDVAGVACSLCFGCRGVPSAGVFMHSNYVWAWCGSALLVWCFRRIYIIFVRLYRKHCVDLSFGVVLVYVFLSCGLFLFLP